jgi:hypothetical protein
MSNPYNAYRDNNLNVDTTVRDYQHAARLFADDNFRLAPKFDFLFHTVFSLNNAAVKDITLTQRHKNEINMLVKNVSLPSIKLSTETIHQYNRKKVVQTGHKFDPCTIKFHDDNMGLIRKLWENYYSYYYADPTSAASPGSAYSRNAMRRAPTNKYGLDNKSEVNFFNHITIYQLARHEYFAYKLINPMIASFDHQSMDYSKVAPHEVTMTLNYEAIQYFSGTISDDTPEGFGTEHYDQTPSPLTLPPGITTPTTSVMTTDSTAITAQTLNNTVTTINNYQNSQGLSNAGQPGIASSQSIGAIGTVPPGGVQGTIFPRVSSTNNNIVAATQVNIVGADTKVIVA